MNDELNELTFKLRDSQQKYGYYLIAISVTAVAYSTNLTLDKKINNDMILLGIAIFLWLSSAFFGLKFLKSLKNHDSSNIEILQAEAGVHPLSGTHPEKIKLVIDTVNGIMDSDSIKLKIYRSLQEWMLYFGVISFIAWRILAMLP